MGLVGPRGPGFRRGRRRGLMVGAAMGAAAARRGGGSEPEETTSQSDQLAELERLAQLKQQGVLTDEEFQAQKRAILGT